MKATAPPVSRRRAWLAVLPFAAVVVLGAAWSGFWYRAAQMAEATVAAWIEREARAGRIYGCGARTIGGYPFRIELRCTDPTVDLASAEPNLRLKSRDLVAIAQVYRPTHIIAEITGPLLATTLGQPIAVADWRLAQASLRGRPSAPERVSVVVDALQLDRPSAQGTERIGNASRLEFHARLDPASTPVDPAFDFFMRIAGADAPVAGLLARGPIDAELTAVLRGVGRLDARPIQQRLKDWQAAGGRLDITNMRLKQGESLAVAKGEIGLTAQGRIDGAFAVTLHGFEPFVQSLVQGSARARQQAGLLAGLGLAVLGQPTQLEGKRAVTVPVRFKDGAVTLGPLLLGHAPPLF